MPDEGSSDTYALVQEIARLKKEKEQLSLQIWRYERGPSRVVGSLLLLFGVLSLLLSFVSTSYIPSLLALGLIFWGIILLSITPRRHTRFDLLDSVTLTLLSAVSRLLKALDFTGKGIYMPPQNPESKTDLVYISAKEESQVPRIDELADNELFSILVRDPVKAGPSGICLPSAGSGLVDLLERESATNFANVDTRYLEQKLPTLFTEVLAVVKDFEIEFVSDLVRVKLKEPVFTDACKQIRGSLHVCSSYGCPLCSSLATILARSRRKPVVIESIEVSSDGKTLDILYRILNGLHNN